MEILLFLVNTYHEGYTNPILHFFIQYLNLFQLLAVYPIVGAICWTLGGLFYKFFYKGGIEDDEYVKMPVDEEPFITIMIPAHNEEVMIEQTIDYMMNEINYTNYEVLVCDDGSKDSTPDILNRLMIKYDNLRVIRIEANKGKAHAFNIGLSFARGEFILSNDADTICEPDALWKYMNYFLRPGGDNLAAITGNVDVQNRSLMVEKSQTVEFSSIVGIIKRGQVGVLGSMYAYSGANTMYRKSAVYDCGLFRQDRATEDISICWDQQYNGWQALFAPNIFFYINVPNDFYSLYNQRKRWAKGGIEAWVTNFVRVSRHPIKNFPKVVMLLDQTLSILFAFYYLFFIIILIIRLLYFIATNDTEQLIHTLDMAFVFSAFITMVGFVQLFISLALDNHHKKFKYLFFASSYMIWYWQMNAITIVTTFIPAMKNVLGFKGEGTWVSPARTKMIDDEQVKGS